MLLENLLIEVIEIYIHNLDITGLQVSLDVLNNDFRPTIPKKTPEVFARLTKRCWDRDPEKRPSFKEIIKELEMMKFP